jgi:hypothetical protein
VKQILIVIILALIMIHTPVNAQTHFDTTEKPIITMEGYDYTKLLFISGYDIISNNVNWFEAGTYSVAYRAKNGSRIVMRKVIVLSAYDFINKGYEYTRIEDKIYQNSSLDKEVLAYVQSNESIVIAYSEYNTMDQDAGSRIAISMIKNGSIEWDITIRQYSYDYITKIIYENNQIVAIGVSYNLQSLQNGWLIILDENGTVIQDISYGGSKRDYFFDIVLFQDSFVVFGKSNSNNGLFVGKRFSGDDYDAIMMVISRQSYTITKLIQFGSTGDDSFEQAVYTGDHFFLMTKTEGLVGDFANGIDNRRSGIVKINLAGTIIRTNWIPLVSQMKFEQLVKIERGQIYTLISMYSPSLQQTVFQLHKVNQDTSITLIDEYVYPSKSHSIKFVQLWS